MASGWDRIEIRDRHDAPPIVASVRPGAGEPVLCLHGLQGRRQVFEALAQAPNLSRNMLIALDFPGFGESAPRTRHGDRLSALADDVHNVTRSLDIERFHVIGHSLGGMVGTLMLAGSDSPVLSLANLEGNLTLSDCGASLAVTTMSLETFQETGFDELIATITASTGPSVHQRLTALQQATALTFYETAQTIVAWSKSSTLLNLFVNSQVPRCLLVGQLNEGKTNILPDFVPRYVIPDAGHFMLLENSSATVSILDMWFSKLSTTNNHQQR